MQPSSEERSWLATAAVYASQITTVAGQMVLPALLGLWVDRLVGTVGVFLVLGAVLGFTSGMYQLVLWVQQGTSRKETPRSSTVEPKEADALAPSGPMPDPSSSCRERSSCAPQENTCSPQETIRLPEQSRPRGEEADLR